VYEGDKSPRIYVDAADVARIIRKRLKAAFPGTKFSVTTSKYAGGASCRATWVDGPTTRDADAVIGCYAGATFDGMIDLKSYRDDAAVGGYAVHWGSDYVFADRDLSPEAKAAVYAELAATLGDFEARSQWDQERDVYRLLQARDLREGVAA
jgi:hypothetical protein